MTLIQNAPGLAVPLEPLIFPSCRRGVSWMLGMPSVLRGLYIELQWRLVFWYLEPYVLFRPLWYLMIVASYIHYPTSQDASRILLRRSAVVQRSLECSVTTSVYWVQQQPFYSLAGGNIGVEVPLESGEHSTDELGGKFRQTAWIIDDRGFVRLEKAVVNGGGNVAANIWLLATLRTNISIMPTSGHMIPASTSFFSKISRSLLSNQQTLPFFIGASISQSS